MENQNYNYVLLMAPIEKGDYVGQIEVVDNSTHIGKKRVENLIKEGYTFVGRVSECPLSMHKLRAGFAKSERDKADQLDDRLNLIVKVCRGDLDDYYKEKATSNEPGC